MDKSMRTVLLCSAERRSQAVILLEKYKGQMPIEVVLSVETISEDDSVVIDWDSRQMLRKSYSKLQKVRKLFFLFLSALIDIDDENLIFNMEKNALEQQDWMLCKTINEAKIESSMIKREIRLNSYPTEIQLESTDICNARCIMCNHFYKNGTHPLRQQSEIVQKLTNLLPYLRTVFLHGNGEPFMVPNIKDYLSEFSKYKIKFATNSNLSIVNMDIIDALRENFTELNVSCDAADKVTYEYIRQGLSFEAFVENCKMVRAECPNLHMRMMSITMRQNIQSLPDIVSFAAELGFNEIVFTELSTDVRLENEEDTMTHYPFIAKKYLQKAISKGIEKGIVVRVPEIRIDDVPENAESELVEFNRTEIFKNKDELDALHSRLSGNNTYKEKEFAEYDFEKLPDLVDCTFTGICDWCVQRPYVDLDGNVSICCINQYVRIGNIFDASFEDIWNGMPIQHIRRMFYEGKLPHFCSGCEFLIQGMLECICLEEKDITLQNKIRMSEKYKDGVQI